MKNPALAARKLSSALFGLTITQFAGADLDLSDMRLLVDLMGRQNELDERFLMALRNGERQSDADLLAAAKDIREASEAMETLLFDIKRRKKTMRTDFLNKMIPGGAPENKTEALRQRVSFFRKREEATARKLSDAIHHSKAAVEALRQAEGDLIESRITQGDLDRAREAAANAITAIGPVEVELEADRRLLRRAGEFLKQQIEIDQAEAGRTLSAEHQMWRREAAAALPAIIAMLTKGAEIESRMKLNSPNTLGLLWQRIANTAGHFFRIHAPASVVPELERWLDDLRHVSPADLSPAATEMLEAKDRAEEAERQAAYERGQQHWAQQERNRIGEFLGRIRANFAA